jgi:hypothetical protein
LDVFHVSFGNGSFNKVAADLITFDGENVLFWADGAAAAGHRTADVESIALIKPESTMERSKKAYPRAYDRWSDEEDDQLREEFAQGFSRRELAELHQRQTSAIRSRLERLGLGLVQPGDSGVREKDEGTGVS